MTITSAALMAARSSTATGDLSDAGQEKILQLRATGLVVGLPATKQAIDVLAVAEPTGPTSTTPGGALLRGTRSTITSTFMHNRDLHRPVRDTKMSNRGEITLRNSHTVVMNDVRVTTLRVPADPLSRYPLAGSRNTIDVPARQTILQAGAALVILQPAAARLRRVVDAGGGFPGGNAS